MKTKKQHYVPRGVLKHFRSAGKLFEIVKAKKKTFTTRVEDAMCQNLLYEHTELPTNAIEKIFASLEAEYIPAADKIISSHKTQPSNIEIKAIIEFIKDHMETLMLFYFRSGALMYEYQYGIKDDVGDQRVANMLSRIMNSEYISNLAWTVNNCYEAAIISSDISLGFAISDQFISTVATSCKSRFTNVSNRQIGMNDTMLLLPLSKNLYLMFCAGQKPDYFRENSHIVLNQQETKQVNEIIYKNSYKTCCGSNQKEMERLARIVETTEGLSQVFWGDGKGKVNGYPIKREIFWNPFDEDIFHNFHTYQSIGISGDKKIQRNDPCPCGSGKKYKKCCLDKCEASKRIMDDIRSGNESKYHLKKARAIENPIKFLSGTEKELLGFDIAKKREQLFGNHR